MATVLALLGLGLVPAARGQDDLNKPSNPIRITLQVDWTAKNTNAASPIEAELTQGRILDLVTVEGATLSDRGIGPRGATPLERARVLGRGPTGQVRVRLEAPIGSDLLIRAGGRLTRFPLAAVVEGPQSTLTDAPIEVVVGRVLWDAIELRLTEGDGTAAPGSVVPVLVGFNVLSPETAQVGIQYTAELRPVRGTQPVWRYEGPLRVLATNPGEPVWQQLSVPMPATEDTYVLEVRARWEPVAGQDGSVISRILKRRRSGPSGSVVRRATLAVLSPDGPAAPSATRTATVDRVDLTRPHAGRLMVAGRVAPSGPGAGDVPVPEAVLVDPGLRDRLRGWIHRNGSTRLGPGDAIGLEWTAVALKVDRPGRPHLLKLTVNGGQPESLGVALVVPPGEGVRPRVLLDSCVSGPAVASKDEAVTFTWPVWPDHRAPVLLVLNRSERAAVALGTVELVELGGDPPPATLVEAAPEQSRLLAVDCASAPGLAPFGGGVDGVPGADVVGLARNLSGYLAHCGASSVVLDDRIADRARRSRLGRQAHEDALGPDQLGVVLRMLARRGMTALVRVDCSGGLPGLPPPESAEALQAGLVRIDPAGRADGPEYQLLRPEVREALRRRLAGAAAARLLHPNLVGVVVELGTGPTLLGEPETGLDDWTFTEFARATFAAHELANLPGLDTRAPGRFAARAKFVTTAGRAAWLDWRAGRVAEFYTWLNQTLQTEVPGAVLAVVTPGPNDQAAGRATRRADQSGEPPDRAWLAVGLDLERWDGPAAPAVWRGTTLVGDDLARDLAFSPELDSAVMRRPRRGVWLGSPAAEVAPGAADAPRLVAAAPVSDEPLGHAMAVIDPGCVVLAPSLLAGHEPEVAAFARVYRALPRPPEAPPTPRLDSGVAVRTWESAGRTFVLVANDTPYEMLQAAVLRTPARTPIDDVGRGLRLEPTEAPGGGQSLVLRLPPFGITALRVAAPGATVEPGGSYLPAMAELDSQAEGLSARLRQGEAFVGPPMPGFETDAPRVGAEAAPAAPLAEIAPASNNTPPPAPRGWSAAGDPANAVSLDTAQRHAGRMSLRLDVRALPASVVCDDFLPPGGPTVTVRFWARADGSARVRVRVEGEASGRTVARQAEVPVGTEWAELAVRVPDLPDGGLERMRLRFEWLGEASDTLWIDDVSVTGQGASESGRRAHRILLEALQAYRARRYADFARLLGSRRARHAAPEAELPELPPLRTGQAGDLPPRRGLR